GRGEADVLASCYRRSFAVADSLGARILAYPAISTGIYGFPAELAASIAVSTIRSLRSSVVGEVLLVAFDQPTLSHYQRHLGTG
ncbi:MAG: macro domain-containing protein, partial [Acidimicrobiales bacterium]